MALSVTNLAYNLLPEEKLNYTNFVDWYRYLRIVLRHENKLYLLETPIPKEPLVSAAKATLDAWIKHKDDSSQVVCLMLATMTPNLQKDFEHVGAYEMLNRLKEMSRPQVRFERFQTVRELVGCKMVEGSYISSHVEKMNNYIEKLGRLGSPLSNELAIYLILHSLPKLYDEFVQNFIMNNNREMSIFYLHMVLKTVEKIISPRVTMIRE